MARAFTEIAFTPAVRTAQSRSGSRAQYAPFDSTEDRGDVLSSRETEFIVERDGFYQATAGAQGWPYVQFRGGPPGFLKVLDERTIGYADFRGNRQYISVGNIEGDARVALILMDYANRRRLKLWGRAKLVSVDDEALMRRLELPSYRARVERAVVIAIEAFDWNCPQHITPRFTRAEIDLAFAPMRAELLQLRPLLRQHGIATAQDHDAAPGEFGDGPLALVIAGLRQLTPRARAYELRSRDGTPLPQVKAGAHIDMPTELPDGCAITRRYSITAMIGEDGYEIAVLRSDQPGGSSSIHRQYRLGSVLHCGLPGNDFELHTDARPALLIAGGIGITPIRAMALELHHSGRAFELHCVARSQPQMPYHDSLARTLQGRVTSHFTEGAPKPEMAALLDRLPADGLVYVCGPARMIDAVKAAAQARGMASERVRYERFTPKVAAADRPVAVQLKRSGKTIKVPAGTSILDAVNAAGVDVPSSCRSGTCGTCAVKVLAGVAEHRDEVLGAKEREQGGLMCLCVSRAKTPSLVLDV